MRSMFLDLFYLNTHFMFDLYTISTSAFFIIIMYICIEFNVKLLCSNFQFNQTIKSRYEQ